MCADIRKKHILVVDAGQDSQVFCKLQPALFLANAFFKWAYFLLQKMIYTFIYKAKIFILEQVIHFSSTPSGIISTHSRANTQGYYHGSER